MAESLPLQKYTKVWIKKRKNNSKKDGRRTISYTLEWIVHGRRCFFSLGPHSTLSFARAAAVKKEKEINSPQPIESLVPTTWEDFRAKYLEITFPGHDLPTTERNEKSRDWGKSIKSLLREKLAMDSFERILRPVWCHDITSDARERFINARVPEVGSAESVDAELRVFRMLFGIMERWNHRTVNSNPFSGRGKATVGVRRKRQKDREKKAVPEYYTVEQIRAILEQADKESQKKEKVGRWQRNRLRALVNFIAYTGARINEAIHLEWDDFNWEHGVVWLRHKAEHDLKTDAAAAPLGLPDALVRILREWEKMKTCRWVFPNSDGKPWITAGPGYKHLDQLKELAKRADIAHATWKMFRHSFLTHGKGRYRMTREQVQAQLRHTTTHTQRHYDHADLQNLHDAVKDLDYRH
jgi:integrase